MLGGSRGAIEEEEEEEKVGEEEEEVDLTEGDS